MRPRETIEAFDRFLVTKATRGDLIVIGGTALALLGIIQRSTRDCDVLEPPVDAQLSECAQEFARQRSAKGFPLAGDWLNHGPASLVQVLPTGWRQRVVPLFQGQALTLRTLGRSDLLATKMWALCDRGTDLTDCIALAPTPEELRSLRPWLVEQDLNPSWPDHVDAVVNDLAQRCHHGV